MNEHLTTQQNGYISLHKLHTFTDGPSNSDWSKEIKVLTRYLPGYQNTKETIPDTDKCKPIRNLNSPFMNDANF